jgi:hypothetical protein
MLNASSSHFGPDSDIGPEGQAHRTGLEEPVGKPPRFRTFQFGLKDFPPTSVAG